MITTGYRQIGISRGDLTYLQQQHLPTDLILKHEQGKQIYVGDLYRPTGSHGRVTGYGGMSEEDYFKMWAEIDTESGRGGTTPVDGENIIGWMQFLTNPIRLKDHVKECERIVTIPGGQSVQEAYRRILRSYGVTSIPAGDIFIEDGYYDTSIFITRTRILTLLRRTRHA